MENKINYQTRSLNFQPEKFPPSAETAGMLKEEESQLTARNLMAGLVKKSNRILSSINTHMFPFDLFPDTINVEEGRVTVITRFSFFSSQVHSVDIKDVSNVFINKSPFFAELIIVSKTFAENEIGIRNLRIHEAILARRIIEGLRVFESKQVDTSSFSREELLAKLEELSTTEIVI